MRSAASFLTIAVRLRCVAVVVGRLKTDWWEIPVLQTGFRVELVPVEGLVLQKGWSGLSCFGNFNRAFR